MHTQRNTTQAVSGGACRQRDGEKKMLLASEPENSTATKASTKPHFSRSEGQPLSVNQCFVQTVGLESFIRTIVKELHLKMGEDVIFDMNSQGTLTRWADVFAVEKTYTTCLGISRRTYTCHGYTHDPSKRLAYFILGEHNERSMQCLPAFDFHVMIFCYYDRNGVVSKVDVQYDQMGFYMECIGFAAAHAWFMRYVITPGAKVWMKAYNKTGLVHPLTFLAQVFITFAIFVSMVAKVIM